MKRIFFATTIALTSIFSGTVNAALIEANHLTAGDNGAFTDTRTGLTFLDFDYTMGKSINDAKLLIQNDGNLTGWRMATTVDVESLFLSITGVSSNGIKSTIRYSGGSALRKVSGSSASNSFGSLSYGLFQGSDDSTFMMGTITYKDTTYQNYVRSSNLDWSDSMHAVYIVKNENSNISADVPVPLMGFAGLGLLALGLRLKKK